MRISQINNNQNNFKAVNQKYYQWAQKEAKGTQGFGELFTQLRFDVAWGNLHPQDGIDTLEAIEKILPGDRKKIYKTIYDYVKSYVDGNST